MVSRVQNIRSTNKNTRPPNTTRQPGEFFVNFADKQFGVIDTNQVPQDLIAIRFHSPDTDYVTGDHVLYQGRAYRAKQAIPASVFNPTYWETAGMADAPADGRFYGRANNAWDLADIVDVVGLQAALDAKAPLVTPAFSGTPTAPTAAAATNTAQIATTAFVKSQGYATIGGTDLAAKVSKAGDTMTGPLTLADVPTVPLHAATKSYVDQKPSGASTNDIPPNAPVNGQMWWETDTGSLFIFYDDGNSQAWVQLNASTVDAYNKSQSDLKYVDVTGDSMTGRLGIGTALPTAPMLHVSRGSAGGAPAWDANDTAVFENAAAAATSVQLLSAAAMSSLIGFSTPTTKNRGYVQYIQSTDNLVMSSAGNTLMNNPAGSSVTVNTNTATTSPTTGALVVTGGIGCSGGAFIGSVCIVQLTGTTASPHGAALRVGYHGTNNYGASFKPAVDNGFVQTFLNAAGTQIGSITASAAGVVYNTSSDGRLKEDLQSFDAGNIIDDTEVYDFLWKEAGERSYGIVAQQAVKVYPQAITYSEKEDWWGVDYSKYVPVILQELKALRARVAELEGEKTPIAPKKRS